jgi:acyl-CoA thioesterase
MGSSFAATTTVVPAGGGRYRARIAEAWNLQPLPQGGIVTATAARAMEVELGHDEQRLRALHTMFVGQVGHGDVDIDVEMLRQGRSMSHLRAHATNPGSPPGHVTTAVFGAPRRGFSFTDALPPDVPPPMQCDSYRDPPPPGVELGFRRLPFWEEILQGRNALGHPPWVAYEPGRAERATWHRFDDPPMLADGRVDPLSLVVMADTMPGAVSEKVGSHQQWFAPSVDLTVHLLDDCRSTWVLAHNRARFAGDGYASAEMFLWDRGEDGTDDGRLVAYATQVFLFRFPD